MIDTTTRKPLTVWAEASAFPFILLSYDHLPEVRRLLDEHGVRYSVAPHVISLDGGPGMTRISLGRDVDGRAVQALLDGVD